MSSNLKKSLFFAGIVAVLLAVILVPIILYLPTYPRTNPLNPEYLGSVDTVELIGALPPYPSAAGVKQSMNPALSSTEKRISITTTVNEDVDSLPRSDAALSDNGIPYATGTQEKINETYVYYINISSKIPSGIKKEDIIRVIFLNLFFKSFAEDASVPAEDRRAAFQIWLTSITNYDEIDQIITKSMK